MKRLLIIFLLLNINHCFCQDNVIIEDSKSLPKLTGFVNDFENIFESHEKFGLKSSTQSFQKQTSIGIIIVTIDSIAPYKDIYDYSLALAKDANIGCVLIVVSKKIRKIQIQNCDPILEKLTDDETKLIIENFIIPEFKKDNYYKGLLNGIAEIKKELR